MNNKARNEEIHSKGFTLNTPSFNVDESPQKAYARLKTSGKNYLEDIIVELNDFDEKIKKSEFWLGNKILVQEALMRKDVPLIRKISDYFYRTNGIY